MKRTFLTSLILISGWAAAAPAEPKIVPVKDNVGIVELGFAVNEALHSFDPEFKLLELSQFIPAMKDMFIDAPNETPMAVVADFNGDSAQDVVVMGHSHKELLVLAVVSGKDGYSVKTVSRSEYTDPENTYYPPMVQDDAVSDESEGDILRQKGLFQYLVIVPPGDDLASGMLKKEFKSKIAAFSVETYFSGSNPVYFMKADQICEVLGTKIVNKQKTLRTKCGSK